MTLVIWKNSTKCINSMKIQDRQQLNNTVTNWRKTSSAVNTSRKEVEVIMDHMLNKSQSYNTNVKLPHMLLAVIEVSYASQKK